MFMLTISLLFGCSHKPIVNEDGEGSNDESQEETDYDIYDKLYERLIQHGSPGEFELEGIGINVWYDQNGQVNKMTIDTNVSMDLLSAVSITSYRVESYGEEEPFLYENLIDDTLTAVEYSHGFKWSNVTPINLENVSNTYINQILLVNINVNGVDYEDVEFDRASVRVSDLNVMGTFLSVGDKIDFPLIDQEYTLYESAYEYFDDYQDYKKATIKKQVYEVHKIYKRDSMIYYNLSNIGWLEVSSKFTNGKIVEPEMELEINQFGDKINFKVTRGTESLHVHEFIDNQMLGRLIDLDNVYPTSCSIEIYASNNFFDFTRVPVDIAEINCPRRFMTETYSIDKDIGFDFVSARLITSYEYDGVTYEDVEIVKKSNIIR